MSDCMSDIRALIEDNRNAGIVPVEEVTDVIVLYRAMQEPLHGGDLREMNGSMKSGMTPEDAEELLHWALEQVSQEKTCCCGKDRGHE